MLLIATSRRRHLQLLPVPGKEFGFASGRCVGAIWVLLDISLEKVEHPANDLEEEGRGRCIFRRRFLCLARFPRSASVFVFSHPPPLLLKLRYSDGILVPCLSF